MSIRKIKRRAQDLVGIQITCRHLIHDVLSRVEVEIEPGDKPGTLCARVGLRRR